MRLNVACFLVLFVLFTFSTQAIETSGRFKLFTSATAIPESDLLQPTEGGFLTDLRLDFRPMFKHSIGSFRIDLEPTITWTGGEATSLQSMASLPLDQLPGTDSLRFFDWSRTVVDTKYHRVVTRIDRFAARYRKPNWSMSVGRQAISWGSGLVFQPLDLFGPFAPTTIDREFKPGVDSILFESLIGSSNELQLLVIERQDSDDLASTRTSALKWHTNLNELGLDLIAAKHLDDEYIAMSMSVPVLSSLLRVDTSRLCDESDCYLSALANLDHTLTLGPSLLYVFVELYRNGYGLDSVTDEMSSALVGRLARGELFTLLKNYASLGVNLNWHPLWSQSAVVIQNLSDNSGLFQTTVNFEPNDTSRVQFGVSVPFGSRDSEFGKRTVIEDLTSGSGSTAFAALSFYY